MSNLVYRLVVTNLKSTNPHINSVTLFFEDRPKAEAAKRALQGKGYDCSNPFGHRMETGVAKNTVDYINAKIGS
jgi:hypothetical protein